MVLHDECHDFVQDALVHVWQCRRQGLTRDAPLLEARKKVFDNLFKSKWYVIYLQCKLTCFV